MSVVTIEEIKDYLGVIHDQDDSKLQILLDGAEDEALQFLDRDTLPLVGDSAIDETDSNQPDPPETTDELAYAVKVGIYLVVQAMYDGADAAEMLRVRKAAEIKWMPYRNRLGV